MTDLQSVPKQRSWNPKRMDFVNFRKLKKTELLDKFELPDRRGFKLTEMRKSFLPPSQPRFIDWAWHLWYGVFPLASLGWLFGYAPSQLLHTCSLAVYGRLEKVLDFLATTENISVINILLVLNPKHCSYWEEN